MALTINGDIFKKREGVSENSAIPADYFSTLNPWGDTSYTDKPNSLDMDTSMCNWFTYENTYGLTKTPNIANGLDDFENGFSHFSPSQTCIDEDQLVFRTAVRDCSGTGSADCIGNRGERYNRGSTQNFNSNCGGSNLPACVSTIGSLTFNFLQDPNSDSSPVDSGTRFLTVSKIYVSQKTFDAISADKSNNFYVNEGGLFEPNPTLSPKEDEY